MTRIGVESYTAYGGEIRLFKGLLIAVSIEIDAII